MGRSAVLVVLGLVWSASTSFGAETLTFPESSIGQIATKPAPEGGFGFDLYGGPLYSGWSEPAPAAGDVTVPEGHVVKLSLSSDALDDLSWVSRLPADAIVMLEARGLPLDDGALEQLTRFNRLKALELSGTKVTSEGMSHLSRLPELRYVGVSHTDVGDEAMAYLAAASSLESAMLYRTPVTDAGLATLSGSPSLKAVYLGYTAITDDGVAALCRLEGLRALNIYAPDPEFRGDEVCPVVTDAAVDALLERPDLEHLDLSGAELTDEGLRRLSEGLPNLRRLTLDNTKVTPAGLTCLSGFRSLESLRCYGITAGDGAAESLSQLKQLREMTGDFSFTDAGVRLLGALPRLESLDLESRGVTDASCAVLMAMPSLKDLRLGHTAVTDDGFAELAGSPTIERVQLTGGRLTTRCVETLATMPALRRVGLMSLDQRVDGEPTWKGLEGLSSVEQELWLCGCPPVETADFAKLATFRRLRQLRVDGSGKITDDDIAHLRELRDLEYVELTSTVATDDSLALLAKLPRLRSLSISCLATDEGLEALAGSASLAYLSIASPNFTDAAIEGLTERSASLRSVRRDDFRIDGTRVSRSRKGDDGFWRELVQADREALDALEGEAAPELAVTEWLNSGEATSLEDFRGKVVLVDFWGTWCGPCVALLPEIRRLRDEYADEGLVVVGVHSTEDADSASEFVSANKLDWPIALDSDNASRDAYGVPHWPTCYLIDRRGVMRMAAVLKSDIEPAVQALLAEEP